ncbi:hypothetical protein NPIL_627111 [Nephila pilipes]|uniref:Uncharacterized protein n=1 Tax=Nephila pilipes TaxID=299642 RepID=A0A8X6UUX2_NEPPI|nr:hypothetical protein NPIL_627111 [Nephila pilipes]
MGKLVVLLFTDEKDHNNASNRQTPSDHSCAGEETVHQHLSSLSKEKGSSLLIRRSLLKCPLLMRVTTPHCRSDWPDDIGWCQIKVKTRNLK